MQNNALYKNTSQTVKKQVQLYEQLFWVVYAKRNNFKCS
jgi:hypothetical protein